MDAKLVFGIICSIIGFVVGWLLKRVAISQVWVDKLERLRSDVRLRDNVIRECKATNEHLQSAIDTLRADLARAEKNRDEWAVAAISGKNPDGGPFGAQPSTVPVGMECAGPEKEGAA